MSRRSRWELVGVAVLVASVAVVRCLLPSRIELGEAVLLAAALLLAQGLVRDLLAVRAARAQRLARHEAEASAPRITCVCAESTLGVSAILAGLLLVFATAPRVVHVPPLVWPIAVSAVTLFGFVTRHVVLDFRTRRLRWEPDHAGVVVWKR